MKKREDIVWKVLAALSGIAAASMICSKLLFGWSSIFSFRVFYVMSGSMEPSIHENSLVIGKLVPENEELAEGEVYAYQRDGILGPQIIIHRLVREDGEGRYLFQGDANQKPDDRVVERGRVGYRIIWGLGRR